MSKCAPLILLAFFAVAFCVWLFNGNEKIHAERSAFSAECKKAGGEVIGRQKPGQVGHVRVCAVVNEIGAKP